jgi:hypothetical protein
LNNFEPGLLADAGIRERAAIRRKKFLFKVNKRKGIVLSGTVCVKMILVRRNVMMINGFMTQTNEYGQKSKQVFYILKQALKVRIPDLKSSTDRM